MAETSQQKLTMDNSENRISDLEQACGMLVMFPGMREFVGDRIFDEVTGLLGPQVPLDVSPNEG